MSDDLKRKVIRAMHLFRDDIDSDEASDDDSCVKPKKSSSTSSKITKKTNTQIAKGNNIIQAGGSINNVTIKSTTKKTNVSFQYPEGSIGANGLLTERITGLFNELGLRREKPYGKSAYAAMYKNFKRDFGIPQNQKYTTYRLWDESRAVEIIDYLESKLSNTKKGRIQGAAKRKGHSQPYLLAETGRLHDMLGWKETQEYRAHLYHLFGVTSRKDLNPSQLANYVKYLGKLIDDQ